MTPGAQQALRRTMEIYSATTRFALACNVSGKIIEPIQSRCAILRYTRLSDEAICKRLVEICEFEQVYLREAYWCRSSMSPRDLKLLSSPRKEICVKRSTISRVLGPVSTLSQPTMCLKYVINHTPSL